MDSNSYEESDITPVADMHELVEEDTEVTIVDVATPNIGDEDNTFFEPGKSMQVNHQLI